MYLTLCSTISPTPSEYSESGTYSFKYTDQATEIRSLPNTQNHNVKLLKVTLSLEPPSQDDIWRRYLPEVKGARDTNFGLAPGG